MALAYWILCRCKECAKLSYFKADGEKVIGREWNRNSSTYKRHTQTHAAKPPASRPDAHDRGALSKKKHVGNRAARTVSRTARAQVPQEIRKPRPSGLSKTDPKATFWTGKTVSCGKYTALNDYFTRIAHPKCQARVLLAACQYFFLHLSSEAINSTLACLKCMKSKEQSAVPVASTFIQLTTLPMRVPLEPPEKAENALNRCTNPQAVLKSVDTSLLNHSRIG
ncbi:hypothetical protein MJO28_006651 [Puccinia striiformis f. sp. tritici]|uniref:Uncharacterized protein n=1 Tax=Puccinia striiformis f. sp. tritici TaxID=168172 RepID=A0ACC0EI08_9BASI|nr:hypothetical protein MJO28_006651 [Puccinia striiformis f. sp. tritici]